MKNLLLIINLIFFFISCNVNASSKIVFIDMDMVISTSKSGANVLKQLNFLKDKNIKDFKEKSKLLKENEVKILNQKNILSPTDYSLKVNNLKKEIKKYNEYRDSKIKNFNQKKLDSTNKLLKLINPILEKYSKDKSISMMLQKKNLVIGKAELDITNIIIDIVDKNIKDFKIK